MDQNASQMTLLNFEPGFYGVSVDKPGVGRTEYLPKNVDESEHADEYARDCNAVLEHLGCVSVTSTSSNLSSKNLTSAALEEHNSTIISVCDESADNETDRKDPQRVVPVGMCAGARYVLPFMRLFPEKVNPKVVAFHAPFISPQDCSEVSTSMKIVDALPNWCVRGGQRLMSGCMTSLFSSLGGSISKSQSKELEEADLDPGEAPQPDHVQAMLNESTGSVEATILMQSWGTPDTWSDEFKQTFFIFTGANDSTIPLAATKWLAERLHKSKFHIEDKCSHGGSFLPSRMRITFDYIVGELHAE